jgi:molybdate transport repressor ModE-like protein
LIFPFFLENNLPLRQCSGNADIRTHAVQNCSGGLMASPTDGDLAVLSAIKRAGTFSSAARLLGVAHTTVSRKLREMEAYYGARLVEHTGDRAVLTAEGEHAARAAGRIEEELLALERAIKGTDGRLSGSVTLTTVDILAWRYMDRLQSICARHPDIEFNVLTDTEVKSLSRREAEVALRLTNTPDEYLFGRTIETFLFAAYARRDVAQRAADSAEGICGVPWLFYASADCAALSKAWMRRNASRARVQVNVSTPLMMLHSVESGLGVGLLPTAIADERAELVRLGHEPAFSLDVWLLAPAELKRTARIHAVFEAFADMKSEAAGKRVHGQLRKRAQNLAAST